MRRDDEREFRLRPRKPQCPKERPRHAWSMLFKRVMRYARMTRKARSRSGRRVPIEALRHTANVVPRA